jgi:hypothetical protein
MLLSEAYGEYNVDIVDLVELFVSVDCSVSQLCAIFS